MLILDTEEVAAADGENEVDYLFAIAKINNNCFYFQASDTPIKNTSLSATPILQGRSIHENGADIKVCFKRISIKKIIVKIKIELEQNSIIPIENSSHFSHHRCSALSLPSLRFNRAPHPPWVK